MATTSAIIACEHVGYRQQHTDILTDIDWQLQCRQHWAVLGPNGSGKTTLLKIACGYLWPTSGRVLRLGEELIDLGELRRSIGWISSSMIADVPPSDTALETVVSGRLGQLGLKRFPEYGPTDTDFDDARAEFARLACDSLVDKQFGILSQGERQQVLIARARMARPLLMVLDEPCAGMDPGVRERFLAWLNERLNDAGNADGGSRHASHRRDRSRHSERIGIKRRSRSCRRAPARSDHAPDNRSRLQDEPSENRDERRAIVARLGLVTSMFRPVESRAVRDLFRLHRVYCLGGRLRGKLNRRRKLCRSERIC